MKIQKYSCHAVALPAAGIMLMIHILMQVAFIQGANNHPGIEIAQIYVAWQFVIGPAAATLHILINSLAMSGHLAWFREYKTVVKKPVFIASCFISGLIIVTISAALEITEGFIELLGI